MFSTFDCKNHRILAIGAVALLFLALSVVTGSSSRAQSSSENYKLKRPVLGEGGVRDSSESFKAVVTVGQPSPMGRAEGDSFALRAGFAYTLPREIRCWTVLVYAAGDNNLEDEIEADLAEMEAVGSSDSVSVLVLFDSKGNGDTHLYYVEEGTLTLMDGQATSWLGEEENMGDPQTLVDFVTWGTRNYPARHYLLVLRNHGYGIWAECAETVNYVDVDYLDLLELDSALDSIKKAQGGQKLDIVAHDACLMGMVELHNQMSPYADIGIASESEEPYSGWHYTEPLMALRADPGMTPREFASIIVDSFAAYYDGSSWEGARKVSQAAVDLAILESDLFPAIDSFAVLCSTYMDSPVICRRIIQARGSTDLYVFLHQHTPPWSLCGANADIFGFVRSIAKDSVIFQDARPLWDAADTLTKIYPTVVFAESSGSEQAKTYGMTIWFPTDFNSNKCCCDTIDSSIASYEDIRFAQGRWPGFLAEYDKHVYGGPHLVVDSHSVWIGVSEANRIGALRQIGSFYDSRSGIRQGIVPNIGDLNSYEVVIWKRPGPLTVEDEFLLRAYLDGGGRLLLINEDLASGRRPVTPFMADYLGVAGYIPDVRPDRIQGVATDPIGYGFAFDVSDNHGDGLISGPGAYPVFLNLIGENASLSGREESYGALRRETGTYRVVFLAFPIEAIADESVRDEVMGRMLNWLNP